MFLKTFRGSVQVLAGVAAGLVIVLLLLVWQLSKGPISLGFLSPYIVEAVNSGQTNFKLKMRDTILTWAGWERSFDIRILDVEVLNKDNEVVSSVPELSFALNRSALLKGEVAPNSIEVFGPKLRFIRQTNGSFNIGFGGAKDVYASSAMSVLQGLLDGPAGNHPLRYLSRLDIVGADLTIDDQILEKSWLAPSADIHLVRDDIGVRGELSLIVDVDGSQTELDLLARYRSATKRIELTADIDKLFLAPFAPAFTEIGFLKNFNLPLQGSVAVSIPITEGTQSVSFDVTGNAGTVKLPEPFSQTVKIKSVSLTGEYESGTNRVEIDKIELELAENQLQLPEPFSENLNLKSGVLIGSYSSVTGIADIQELSGTLGANWKLFLPAPIDHQLPLRSFSMSGQYNSLNDVLSIGQFDADLQGPLVSLAGRISGARAVGAPIDAKIDIEIKDVPVSDVTRYWPKTIAPDPYNWIVSHLSEGTLHQLQASSQFQVAPDGAIAVQAMNGKMQLSGVQVDYLPPMPKATGVSGDVVFDNKTLKIDLSDGQSQDLRLSEGEIILSGLDVVDQYADIHLVIDGSVKSKLAYIEADPLGFASELGIDPKKAEGQGQTDLKMKFILEHTLELEDVVISASSKLTNVALGDVLLGRGIKNSSLGLEVDNHTMKVSGNVVYDGIEAELVWVENFDEKADFQSRYDLFAVFSDVGKVRDLGFDMEHFADEYLKGSIGAKITYTVFDDVDRRLEVDADITEAELQAPAFGWVKKAGAIGHSDITIDLERDVVVDIPEFSLKAAGLNIAGSVKYAPDGTGISQIDFSRLVYGRTDVKGALIPKDDGGWEVGLHGPSFDFSVYWDELFSGEPGEQGKESLLPNLTLAIEIDRVWINQLKSMENVSGTFSYADEIWKTFLLSSNLDDGATLDISIQPNEQGNRNLTLRSDDAGNALRFLDAYHSMNGGSLTITGIFEDAQPGNPLHGQLSVNDYRIVDAPALAHVLSIMALTGILDALSGDGIGFNSLEVPFVYDDGVLQITEARANGTSLGFTAGGRIYRHADVVDLKGTVVPAYALNSALGHIPLLGTLLTGGKKGSGVFAANYTMSGSLEEPKVSVNPLSALTPGFLRNLFGVFDAPEPDPKFAPGENLKITRP